MCNNYLGNLFIELAPQKFNIKLLGCSSMSDTALLYLSTTIYSFSEYPSYFLHISFRYIPLLFRIIIIIKVKAHFYHLTV